MSLRVSDVRALAQAIADLTVWLRRETPQTVSLSTLSALSRLSSQGPRRVSDLAATEAMTQPGITMLVNRLADAGWAERVPDPTDRRATLVRITAAGEHVLAERHTVRAEILRERMAQLSDEDQQLITEALPAIERLIRTRPTESDDRKSQS